ncbi:7-cyano-7-deazaguanine synthase [Methanothermococcus sp. SCGC AD-155-E23]|nr:7-cyano-7-deazaguanine synthase [Methanothermococcus sp. SCGC AD-155-E23]
MKKAYVLFSGGKDSSLSAVLLKKLGYDVELVTVNFGVLDSYKYAQETADILNMPHRVEFLDREVIERSVDIILRDGYPARGIQYLHKSVIEILADRYKVIADGIRRDDRVPKLSHSEIQSIEMRKNIEYITPLMGFGHKTIKYLVDRYFIISQGESDTILKSDYESEIRALIKARGKDPRDYFPKHVQSRVIGVKEGEG